MDDTKNISLLGSRIRRERNRLGISQQVLADEIGVTKSTVSGWEGEGKIPDIQCWPALMRFLRTNADEFLHLVLGGEWEDPLSPEALSRRLAAPSRAVAPWARSLSGQIMERAENLGAPHNHYAGMLLSALLMYAAEEKEGCREGIVFHDLYYLADEAETYKGTGNPEKSLSRRFVRREEKNKDDPSVMAYRAWLRAPENERKASSGLVVDALLPLVEWEGEEKADKIFLSISRHARKEPGKGYCPISGMGQMNQHDTDNSESDKKDTKETDRTTGISHKEDQQVNILHKDNYPFRFPWNKWNRMMAWKRKGDADVCKPFTTDSPEEPKGNMILSEKTRLMLCTNTFVTGSREEQENYIVSHIQSASESYVIPDPCGRILEKTGSRLKEKGYEVKVLDLRDPDGSCKYNPVAYVNDDLFGMWVIVNCMMDGMYPGYSTSDGMRHCDDDQRTVSALLHRLFMYSYKVMPQEGRTLQGISQLLGEADIPCKDGNYGTALDYRLAELYGICPDIIGDGCFRSCSREKEMAAIRRVKLFIDGLLDNGYKDLTSSDDMELEYLGYRKQAVFLITDDAMDDHQMFLQNILLSQTMRICMHEGEERRKNTESPALPVPVRFFLQDFSKRYILPNFANFLATGRKYSVSWDILDESAENVENANPWDAGVIFANCRTLSDSALIVPDDLGKPLG